MKNATFGKGLAVGIVLLFVGVASGSAINTNISKIPSPSESTLPSHKEMVEVTCGVSTIEGICEIKKELHIEDVKKLSQLMNESRKAIKTLQNSNALIDEINEANLILDIAISELKKFGMLPATMSLEEAKDLITGSYGQRIYGKNLENLGIKLPTLNENLGLKLNMNIASRVQGFGFPVGIYPLSTPFVLFLIIFNTLWDIAWELELPIFCDLFMSLTGFFGSLLFYFGLRPRACIPIGIVSLEPLIQGWDPEPATLETGGLLGHWYIEDIDKIILFVIGFVGFYGFLGLFGFTPFILAR